MFSETNLCSEHAERCTCRGARSQAAVSSIGTVFIPHVSLKVKQESASHLKLLMTSAQPVEIGPQSRAAITALLSCVSDGRSSSSSSLPAHNAGDIASERSVVVVVVDGKFKYPHAFPTQVRKYT